MRCQQVHLSVAPVPPPALRAEPYSHPPELRSADLHKGAQPQMPACFQLAQSSQWQERRTHGAAAQLPLQIPSTVSPEPYLMAASAAACRTRTCVDRPR